MKTQVQAMRKPYFLPAWVAGVVVAIWAVVVFSLAQNAHAAALDTYLSLGSSDPSVVDLQTFLKSDASIYPEGLVTGYFGPLTEAAVVRFQAANGIKQTGTVGPITRAAINAEMSASGNASANVDNGGPSDVYAPIISSDSVTVGKDNATVSWSTNEAATGKVYYSIFWPFYYATAPQSANATYVRSHSIALNGLTPNTTYYYAKESVDPNGNIMWTTHKSFKTTQ